MEGKMSNLYLIVYINYRSGERSESIDDFLFKDFKVASEYIVRQGYVPYYSEFRGVEFELADEDRYVVIRKMMNYDF